MKRPNAKYDNIKTQEPHIRMIHETLNWLNPQINDHKERKSAVNNRFKLINLFYNWTTDRPFKTIQLFILYRWSAVSLPASAAAQTYGSGRFSFVAQHLVNIYNISMKKSSFWEHLIFRAYRWKINEWNNGFKINKTAIELIN